MVWKTFRNLLTFTLAAFLADAASLSKTLLDENPCNCPTYVFPVCGSNGKTYRNECYFICDREKNPTLWKATNTPCNGLNVLLMRSLTDTSSNCRTCPLVILPVCGSDGVTYVNDCFLDCTKKYNPALYQTHRGFCGPLDVSQKLKTTDDNMLSGCMCPQLFFPVCGSDGITYVNDCYLDCAKRTHLTGFIHRKHGGYCGILDVSQKSKTTDDNMLSGCMCPQFFIPVCGSDGITYVNDCYLDCAKYKNFGEIIYKKHEGYCGVYDVSLKSKLSHKELLADCTCPETFRPVCGSNGVTYKNICFLDCDSYKRFETLYVRHEGICKSHDLPRNTVTPGNGGISVMKCLCPNEYVPVCGSDGITYINNCNLKCASVTSEASIWIAHNGSCTSEDQSQKKGSEQHGEVVSADFIDQTSTKQHFEGRPEVVNCNCPATIYSPICGTDGVTYKNICFLECAIINSEKKMWKAHDGSCDDINKRFSDLIIYNMAITLCGCSNQQYPVCGSDGVTYQNECFLDCQKFFTNHGLWKDYDGNCRKPVGNSQRYMKGIDWCRCSTLKEPVCGTDGNTYHNECYLKCEQFFHNHALWKDYDGPCKESIETPLQNKQDGLVCSCPAHYAPLCGTRGGRNVTYRNHCIFDCIKSFHSDIYMIHDGECTEDDRVHRLDSALHLPIFQYGDDWGNWEWDSYVHGFKGVAAMNLDTISAVGLQKQKECIEDMEWNPVCGTDGKTYMNEALLECVKMNFVPDLMKVHDGKCEEDDKRMIATYQDEEHCHCPTTYEPLCGSDGSKYITYQNRCTFQCMRLKYPRLRKVHDGKCRYGAAVLSEVTIEENLRNCTDQCSPIYEPICGNDGQTYVNTCYLLCYKLIISVYLQPTHKGQCIVDSTQKGTQLSQRYAKICSCPDVTEEVCGNDGVTYKNECLLKCIKNSDNYGLEKKYNGPCKILGCVCPSDRDPVCGSDSRTYKNPCFLKCEQENYNKRALFMVYPGRCRG